MVPQRVSVPQGSGDGRQRACHKPRGITSIQLSTSVSWGLHATYYSCSSSPIFRHWSFLIFQRIQITIESHCCAWGVTANPKDALRFLSVAGIWYFPRTILCSYHENVIMWVRTLIIQHGGDDTSGLAIIAWRRVTPIVDPPLYRQSTDDTMPRALNNLAFYTPRSSSSPVPYLRLT